MRSRKHTTTIRLVLVCLLIAFGTTAAYAGGANKVNVCHIPPGNPANFHTITISEKALSAHLNHGDLAGTCEENCESLCDDGNPCTQDVDSGAAGCSCLATGTPVDCDDSNLCTADSCDSAAGGCLNVPIDCADGDLCTVDSCDPLSGNCANPPIACGTGESCDPSTGSCVDPCDGIICEPLDQCHVAGTCTDGVCDNPVAPDGTTCDDGDASTTDDVCTAGVCAGEMPPGCFPAGTVCDPFATPNPCCEPFFCLIGPNRCLN